MSDGTTRAIGIRSVEHLNVFVALLGGLVLLLALVSQRLEATVAPSLIALAVGILVGPEVLDWVDLGELGEPLLIVEGVTRLALGIGLVGVALRIPREFPRQHWRQLAIVIGAGMVLMWAMSTAVVFVVLGLPFWLAALIGAIVTPTDPIAATPIVTGPAATKNLPERLRHLISFESGANDGLGYALVFLAFLLYTLSVDAALAAWFVDHLLWAVGFATLVGIGLGFAAGNLLRAVERGAWISEHWRLAYMVALTLLALGMGRLLGSDEILIAFAAGAAFVQVVSSDERGVEEQGQELVNRFFAVPVFAVIGAAIPWAGWGELGWSGLVTALLVLVLRRPPVFAALHRFVPLLTSWRDTATVGWFGPIAISSAYYATLTAHRLGEPVIWHATSLVIAASVVAHGLTAVPIARWYGRTARGG